MACGTGKTFTSLKLAENFARGLRPLDNEQPSQGRVLVLAPSIALLSQSLAKWSAQSNCDIQCFVVCSDTSVGKRKRSDQDEIGGCLTDIPIPVTTDSKKLAYQVKRNEGKAPLAVIFSFSARGF